MRWSHFIVGIAWIGSSFYFFWLDANLNRPPKNPENDRVGGDLWSVHGGGFYHAQKYQVSPAELPEPLHWFKWEAYTTWLTGFALLIVTYYFNASTFLIDPAIREMTPITAVSLSVLLLVAGWIVYDLLCKLVNNDTAVAAVGFLLLAALCYGLSFLFSGRGAYMQVGAMLGTIMAANVAMVIIPGQRKMVDAMVQGEEPDPLPGIRAKQRSMHNNYFTLPVLFVMISNHYPVTYGHPQAWLVLMVLFVIGAAVRHYFNLRNVGQHVPAIPVAALVAVAALAFAIAPRAPVIDEATQANLSLETVTAVVVNRCQACHAANPTHPTAPVAPKGVMLENTAQVEQWADAIYQQTVVARVMPLANLTGITEEERELIAAWYLSRE